uniref:AN1-type zinc finger protein 4 n=1 Tax=Panagrolaimus sp. PS1159 TaxID=55785 RepID=A0AC35EUF7_9BILA
MQPQNSPNNGNNNNGNNGNIIDDPTTQSDPSRQVIMITIRSVMERDDLCRIQIRTYALVRELRIACHFRIGPKAESQSLIFDGKELKDDDKMLADYGLKSDCVVQLAPKMASGTLNRNPQADVILIVPDFIPQNVTTMADLRETIRNMHTSLPSKLPATNPNPPDKKAHMWTPEKQMEHEVTRNRMKALIQRRKRIKQQQSPKKTALSPSASSSDGYSTTGEDHSKGSHSPKSGESHDEAGSICGSVGRSPLGSEPGMYFNPPETTRQAEMLRRDLYTPPTNREGLKKLKEHFIELQKSTCGVCKRRLPLIQQSLKCRCKKVFCPKHRNAEQHKCSVDYKLAGRKKLEKEVPKIEMGGARKAKLED